MGENKKRTLNEKGTVSVVYDIKTGLQDILFYIKYVMKS